MITVVTGLSIVFLFISWIYKRWYDIKQEKKYHDDDNAYFERINDIYRDTKKKAS